MANVERRAVDPQGRLLLPSWWRKKHMVDGDEVYMVILDDRIEILPLKSDLKKFVDSVEVDIPEGSFLDYHKLRKELRREFK
jgi:bifunctional DNA-binding transcriptional regulator/antitoxin component of YhaV-PrlF toxin-antitoxin module